MWPGLFVFGAVTLDPKAIYNAMGTTPLFLALLAALGKQAGLDPALTRPACNAEMRGKYWPLEANDDRALAQRLLREGRLELCTRGVWRYRWISPTVHYSTLGHK
jgi:hypothetical protein